MTDVDKALAYFKDEEPETYSSWGMGAILAHRVAELEDILKTQVDVSRQHEAAAARLERRVAELESALRDIADSSPNWMVRDAVADNERWMRSRARGALAGDGDGA